MILVGQPYLGFQIGIVKLITSIGWFMKMVLFLMEKSEKIQWTKKQLSLLRFHVIAIKIEVIEIITLKMLTIKTLIFFFLEETSLMITNSIRRLG